MLRRILFLSSKISLRFPTLPGLLSPLPALPGRPPLPALPSLLPALSGLSVVPGLSSLSSRPSKCRLILPASLKSASCHADPRRFLVLFAAACASRSFCCCCVRRSPPFTRVESFRSGSGAEFDVDSVVSFSSLTVLLRLTMRLRARTVPQRADTLLAFSIFCTSALSAVVLLPSASQSAQLWRHWIQTLTYINKPDLDLELP